MAESTIPVDLFNPGQVFACLGFMELADVLLGEAAAGFDWSDPKRAVFRLTARSNLVITMSVPSSLFFLVVLGFLVTFPSKIILFILSTSFLLFPCI